MAESFQRSSSQGKESRCEGNSVEQRAWEAEGDMQFFKSIVTPHPVRLVSNSSLLHDVRGPDCGSTG